MKAIETSGQDIKLLAGVRGSKYDHQEHRRIRVLGVICCIAWILLATLGCTSCTKPNTGSITGRMVLVNDSGNAANDPVDFSGVTLALYELAEFDTTMVRLNAEYPQIGVLISQETEFDHRKANPTKISYSAADGSFSMPEIDPGRYNLVIFKPGWGIRYRYQLEVTAGGENDQGDIVLFPETEYGQYVASDQVFQTGHTYLISQSTTFNCNICLEAGALVLIGQGYGATILGNVHTEDAEEGDEPWKILTASQMYSTSAQTLGLADYFGSLAFDGSQTLLRGGVIRQFTNTINFRSGTSEIDHVIFSQFEDGVLTQQGNASFSNLVFSQGNETALNIHTTFTGEIPISNCIFTDVRKGATINSLGTFTVDNCYFNRTFYGVAPYGTTGSVTHCCFDQNFNDIPMNGVITPMQIEHNNFYLSIILSIIPSSQPLIRNNNFFRTEGYFIKLRQDGAPPEYAHGYGNVNARENYWAVSDVDEFILDATDNDMYPNQPCAYYVFWSPRRGSRVPDAGIQ